MEKLREAVINSASSNLNAELSSSQIALIDQRLRDSFPHGLRVPSHPTYATMVLKAITELSEENGSSEDTISEYIKENYDDLPWAHKSILNHHLNKLCDDGVIVLTATNRYLTSAVTPKLGRKKGKLKRKQVMMKQRVTCQKNSGTEVLEEHNLVCENQDCIGSDNEGGETGQEDLVKFSIPELVKSRTRKTQKSCDQLFTEEEISVDECQDKNRNENLALEENSSDEEYGASLESPVKKKKKDVGYTEVREIVYAITKQLPMTTKSGRRVTRQLSNSKEQQNKLILSTVGKFPSSELQKEDLSLTRQDNYPVGDIDCGITKKLRIKLKKRDNLELLLSMSSQETKSKWPSWIPSLLQTNFNGRCEVHENAKNNICNLFCSYCKRALCSSCVASHDNHHVITINQSNIEILVDISDVGMLDLSGIRAIEETIFLKKEIASLHRVRGNNSCIFSNCKSRVPYPFKFCSLKCKFEHDVKAG